MVRIGLVGSGFMAETHLERYRSMEDVEVVAVVSPRTAEAFIAEQGLDATAYTETETFLEETALDAVDVCSPTPTHRDAVVAAAARGLDVFCEKPLAVTLKDASAIADAVDTHGVTLMVGHVLRYFPAYRRLKAAVEDGAVGTPGVARARRLSPFPTWGAEDWFADDDKSGGVFLDLAIHEFDFLRWTLGAVERVFARRSTWGTRQNGHATLRFADGAVGYVEAGWDRPQDAGLQSAFELAGDEGLLEYDSAEPEPLTVRTDDGTPGPIPTVEHDGYHRELVAFVECVREGGEPPVTVDAAIEAMRISIAANRSAERGAPVALEEVTA